MEAEDVGTADLLDVLAVMVALWNSEIQIQQQEQQEQQRNQSITEVNNKNSFIFRLVAYRTRNIINIPTSQLNNLLMRLFQGIKRRGEETTRNIKN